MEKVDERLVVWCKGMEAESRMPLCWRAVCTLPFCRLPTWASAYTCESEGSILWMPVSTLPSIQCWAWTPIEYDYFSPVNIGNINALNSQVMDDPCADVGTPASHLCDQEAKFGMHPRPGIEYKRPQDAEAAQPGNMYPNNFDANSKCYQLSADDLAFFDAELQPECVAYDDPANDMRTNICLTTETEAALYDFNADPADFDNLMASIPDTHHPINVPDIEADLFSQFVNLTPSPEPSPPSSVLRQFDTASISTDISRYDASLQYSPPNTGTPAAKTELDCEAASLEATNWEFISAYGHPPVTQAWPPTRNISVDINKETQSEAVAKLRQSQPSQAVPSLPRGMDLRPFKAFFHISDMLEAKATLYKHQPSIQFELFARYIHSEPKSVAPNCPFRLGDLFHKSARLPAMLLPGTENTLQLCKASDIKCYCRCTIKSNDESGIGYFLALQELRKIAWNEIVAAADYMGI